MGVHGIAWDSMGVKAFDASRTFFSREKPFQNKGLSFGGGWWRRAAGDVSGGWLTLWIKMWRMARRLWRKWSRRPVSRVLSLPCGRGQPFLWDARCRAPLATNPDSGAEMPLAAALSRPAGRPYSVLLPVGFTLPPPLPGARCALAAPFHPCPRPWFPMGSGRFVFCGTFPGVAPAGR